MYTDPKDVTSPQVSVAQVRPILDLGEWEYSVALLLWEKRPSIGIRWNGGKKADGKIHPGTPQSRGLSTWLIVPKPYEVAILEIILSQGCGGGNIDAVEAEKAIKEAIARIKSETAATPELITEDKLEAKIAEVFMRMKEQGLL